MTLRLTTPATLLLERCNSLTRMRKRTTAKQEPKAVISPLIIGIVVAMAILGVGGLIVLGNQANRETGTIDLSQFPAQGDPDAPVTMVDYSDYG